MKPVFRSKVTPMSIPINKTEASYQLRMLEMMSQMVKEQKQNNYLLKKLVGQSGTSFQSSNQDTPSQPHERQSENNELTRRNENQRVNHLGIDIQEIALQRKNAQHLHQNLQNSKQPTENHQGYSIISHQRSYAEYQEQVNQKFFDVLTKMQRKLQQSENLAAEIPRFQQILRNQNNLNSEVKTSINSQIGDQMVTELREIKKVLIANGENMNALILKRQNNQEKESFNLASNNAENTKAMETYQKPITREQKRSKEVKEKQLIEKEELFEDLMELDKRESTFEKVKQYSRLLKINQYCDKRQIKVKVSFYEMFGKLRKKIQNKKQLQKYISEWLGITYRATASICWNLLQSRQLNFDQVKIVFTENIIYNFIELTKDINRLQLKQFADCVPELINKKSIDVLEFLCKQYPQTKNEIPNINLRSAIPNLDEKGRIQYQLVGRSKVEFKWKKGKDYAPEIMTFLNYLIDISNKYYGQFQEFMTKFFKKLYVPDQYRHNDENYNPHEQQNISYAEKVKSYTHYIINRKIPKNTPKYTEQQIQNGTFFIKSSTVLRVVAKWVQELTDIIKRPDSMVRDWFYSLKDHAGNQQYALYPIKKAIYDAIIESRQQLFIKLQGIRKQCYLIQGQLVEPHHIQDKEQTHLSEQQMNIGLFSSNIKNALSSYLCEQLNEVINFLLQAPLRVDGSKIGTEQDLQQKSKAQLESINLITLRLFDLLRCKCASGEKEVIWFVNQLLILQKVTSHLQPHQKFTVVRFKDRLHLGPRDILINAKYGHGPVFQIQISVSEHVDKKQQMLDKYNHFLYEIKRATMLGPLIQNISIWSSLEQKSSYFDELVARKFYQSEPLTYQHQCSEKKPKFRKQSSPMVCSSCNVFFHIPRTCLLNWECESCKSKVCGQCLYSMMNSEQRKKQLFGKTFNRDFLGLLRQLTDKQKYIPKSAFIFRKDHLKAELRYMTSYSSSGFAKKGTDDGFVKGVETIIRGNAIVNRQIINSNQLKKLKDFIIFQYDSAGRTQYLTINEIMKLDNQNDNRLRFVNLLIEPNYIDKIRVLGNLRKKQKLLTDLQKIIGDKKIEVIKLKKILILIQVSINYNQLQKELVFRDNLDRLKQFAYSNSSVISIEKKRMTTEMNVLYEKIGPNLYQALCEKLVKLYLNYGGIESISSLSRMVNLESLYISDNKIKSLNGVEKMVKLRIINFEQNAVESLQPLQQLRSLIRIMGNKNRIKSLKGIKELTKLQELYVHQNQIQKIQQMEKLQQLKLLFIRQNVIERLQGLGHLKRLQKLRISDNNFTQIENLEELKNLKLLSICKLRLEFVPKALLDLTNLAQLHLHNNKISKIQNLHQLKDLKILGLNHNQIQVIEGLENLKLTHLSLDSNKITVLSGLKSCLDSLEVLSIRENPIQDCGDLINIELEFKIYWSKDYFKAEAKNILEKIFRNEPIIINVFNKLQTMRENSIKQGQLKE